MELSTEDLTIRKRITLLRFLLSRLTTTRNSLEATEGAVAAEEETTIEVEEVAGKNKGTYHQINNVNRITESQRGRELISSTALLPGL